VEQNKELIMLKRKAEKSEEDKNTLQQDMTSAITLAQDAKMAKENEIRDLQVQTLILNSLQNFCRIKTEN
jgi:hypothetical protein